LLHFYFNYKNILNTLIDVKFCPNNIIDYFKKCNNCFLISSIKYDIKLYVFHVNDLSISITKIMNSIKQVIVLKEFFMIKKNFNIFFITSPYKRFFPSNNQIVTSDNINGGFTSINKNNIYILRTEEFSKVLLHEILHHVNVIHNEYWDNNDIKLLKDNFKIHNKTYLIPNEAVVELWATMFNCIFLSLYYKISFKKLIHFETSYSIQQYHKLLQIQNNQLWYEDTNAYAYIIFKTILLYKFKNVGIYPYKSNYITQFLIKNKDIIKKNNMIIKNINNVSMRMLRLSDL